MNEYTVKGILILVRETFSLVLVAVDDGDGDVTPRDCTQLRALMTQ